MWCWWAAIYILKSHKTDDLGVYQITPYVIYMYTIIKYKLRLPVALQLGRVFSNLSIEFLKKQNEN